MYVFTLNLCRAILTIYFAVFGNTQPAQQPQAGGGLFGNTGGSLFGNNQQQQQQQQQPAQNNFSLFGQNKPAAPATGGGLFGGGFGQSTTNTNTAPQQQSTGLFGNSLGQSTNQSTGAFGGGLFGAKPATQTQPQSQPLGGSLFGNSLGVSALNPPSVGGGGQGSLQASIAQPQSANLPIFTMLPATAPSLQLSHLTRKKTPFDIPNRVLPPRPLSYVPGATKLRGYTSTSSKPVSTNGFNGSNSLFGTSTSGKSGSLGLSTMNGRADGAGTSSVLGSGSRRSVKKLILDRKVDPSDLMRRSSTPVSSKPSNKPTFVPALVHAALQHEALSTPPPAATPPPATRGKETRPIANNATTPQNSEPQEGEYWTSPPIDVLQGMGHPELSAVSNFVVGRVGFGEVHFLEPVDLTAFGKLSDLLGDQVRFDPMECAVYPDTTDVDKPPVGSGLNVPTRIKLFRCWPINKATREPIKDESSPAMGRYRKMLSHMKGTKFESYDAEKGTWTFTVDHF